MTTMLRRRIAVAVVVAGISVAACAQRGGGRGGSVGHGGGFTARGGAISAPAPAFRSGFAPTRPAASFAAPRYSSPQFRAPANFRMPARGGSSGFFDRRRDFDRNDRYRRSYVPYSVVAPYVFSGWYDTNSPGYPDFLGDPGYGYGPSASAAEPPAAAYPSNDAEGMPQQAVEQTEIGPPAEFRPLYQRPLPETVTEDAVTLVFKDGRPSEEIHNYMLTRTTLYVRDGRPREIPVTDLDLAATEKVNRAAGVDFQLPADGK